MNITTTLPILAHWSELLCNGFAFWDSGFCFDLSWVKWVNALFPPFDTLTSPLLLHVRIQSLKSPWYYYIIRLLRLPVNMKVHTRNKWLPKWLISHTPASTRLSLWLQSKSHFFTFGVHNNLWKNTGGLLLPATFYYLYRQVVC